jgi:hypothetical protein
MGFLKDQVAARMVSVMMRVENEIELPSVFVKYSLDRMFICRIYYTCCPRCLITDQISVVVEETWDDVDV